MTVKQQVIVFKGMIYALIAGICSTCSGMFVKLTHNIHSLEILIFRDIIQFSVCFLVVLKKRYRLCGVLGERKFILLRCIFGTISLSCWFVSVKMTKFGDAGAIYYSYPAFITLLARIFLKEPFGLFDLATVVAAIAGIILIAGPHYVNLSHTDMIGVILASIACCGISCGNLAIRKIQQTPAPVVVCWFSAFSGCISAILVPIVDRYVVPENEIEWFYIVMVGVFGVLTQIFVTVAFQLENAGPISVTESFNMIFSFVFQYFIFKEPITWTSGLGAALVALSVFAIGIRKYLKARNDFKASVSLTNNDLHHHPCYTISTVSAATSSHPPATSISFPPLPPVDVTFPPKGSSLSSSGGFGHKNLARIAVESPLGGDKRKS